MYLYFISDNILFSNTSQMKWNNIEDVFLFSDNPTLQQYNNNCFRTKYTSINKIYDSIEYLVTLRHDCINNLPVDLFMAPMVLNGNYTILIILWLLIWFLCSNKKLIFKEYTAVLMKKWPKIVLFIFDD